MTQSHGRELWERLPTGALEAVSSRGALEDPDDALGRVREARVAG